ncbi:MULTISPECIES: helix-turn-helix domain-containing protein [unclassified Micromonospora]|uniref:helix-turn-helix domain-containing protein n=1 Tax=unclassified Micromonospora TaxID=2617518 RepID=UPI001B385E5C|nr:MULTISPECIES: helix-turn-helix domain-containing protein [unclassified Micromonospora]MBQ1041629.1 helix-turn-helix domain-containing protein [Micromonospora sp. C72]MBQ1053326.1 helix-turn-helix domain-containing protein [Micromonospora sp. C32]
MPGDAPLPAGSADDAVPGAVAEPADDAAVPHDESGLLRDIARQGRRLLDAPAAFVAVVSEDGPTITVRAADGPDEGGPLDLPGHHPSGAALLDGSALWCGDADSGPPPDAPVSGSDDDGPLHAVVAVRLGHMRGYAPRRSVAALYLADRRPRTVTAGERVQLTSFARLAGAAMEKTQLLDVAIARLYGLEQQSARTAADLDRLRTLRSAHYGFIDLAVARGDARAFVVEADRRLGASVRLCTDDGLVVAASRSAGPGTPDGRRLVVPVLAGDRRMGDLLLEMDSPLADPDGQLLLLIAQAAAVILRQLDDSRESQARRALLNELITTPQPTGTLVERARRLGVRLDRPYVVVVLRPDGVSPHWASMWSAAFAARGDGLSALHDDDIVLLLPGEADPAEIARTAAEESGTLFGRPVTAAASDSGSGPEQVAVRYRQALRCLDVMIMMELAGRGVSVRELGFLPMLLAGREGIDQFIDATLQPVLDYDRHRDGDLARTLDAYFEAGRSPTNAAELLHMHPNTVTRRLDRVKRLLGPTWQLPARALEIQLALRLHRLLTEL